MREVKDSPHDRAGSPGGRAAGQALGCSCSPYAQPSWRRTSQTVCIALRLRVHGSIRGATPLQFHHQETSYETFKPVRSHCFRGRPDFCNLGMGQRRGHPQGAAGAFQKGQRVGPAAGLPAGTGHFVRGPEDPAGGTLSGL